MKQEFIFLLVSTLVSGSNEKRGKSGKCGKRNSISRSENPPHIILILADDLGWNEVSWNNPQFLTPHLQVSDMSSLLTSILSTRVSPVPASC